MAKGGGYNQVVSGLHLLRKHTKSTRSRKTNLVNSAGDPGTRLAPPRTGNNDKKICVRIDRGPVFTKTADGKEYQRVKLQINKDAENRTLAELERKNKHAVWAEADIPVGPKTEAEVDQAVDDLFDDLEPDIERRSDAGSDSETSHGQGKANAKGKKEISEAGSDSETSQDKGKGKAKMKGNGKKR